MLILDGKATAAQIRGALRREIEELSPRVSRKPCLAVILVGDDPASQIYVRYKEKACVELGMDSQIFRLPADTSQSGLQALIDGLNNDRNVDGILLQLPLPEGLDPLACVELIRPDKDVDGLHPENQGRIACEMPGLRPCTPAGCLTMLGQYNLSPKGKKAVVVGRSLLVGRPLAILLATREFNATVTMCHSGTADLAAECRQADFLFVAIGVPKAIGLEMVKPGAVVVDIGMNRMENGKLCGDVDYDAVSGVVSAITPVPGGVGPMTITQLMTNAVLAWKAHHGLAK